MSDDRFIALHNSFFAVLEALFDELAARGLLSKEEFSKKLSDLAAQIEKDWGDEPGVYDVKFIQHLAQMVKPEYKQPFTEDSPSPPDNDTPGS